MSLQTQQRAHPSDADDEACGWPEPTTFVGGWANAIEYVRHLPDAASQPDVHEPPEGQTPGPGFVTRLRAALSTRAETRRANRAFRRNQRGFQRALDCCAHDPAAQREMQTIWSTRP